MEEQGKKSSQWSWFFNSFTKVSKFPFICFSFLDTGAEFGGWGRGGLCQLLHAVMLGTSWKLHCMHLLCHSVCFFKQFDILSRQQPGKFAFQMQLLWLPVSTWSIFAPFSNGGPNSHTWLTALAGCAVRSPIRASPPRMPNPVFCRLTQPARLVVCENSARSKTLIFFPIPGFLSRLASYAGT